MDLALKGAQRDANDGPCALSSPPSTAPSSRPHSAGMDLQRYVALKVCVCAYGCVSVCVARQSFFKMDHTVIQIGPGTGVFQKPLLEIKAEQ